MKSSSFKSPFPYGRFAAFVLGRFFPWPLISPAWKSVPHSFMKWLGFSLAVALGLLGVFLAAIFPIQIFEWARGVSRDPWAWPEFGFAFLFFGFFGLLGVVCLMNGWQFLAEPSGQNARDLASTVVAVLFLGGLFRFAVGRFEQLLEFYSLVSADPFPSYAFIFEIGSAYLFYRLLRKCLSDLSTGLRAQDPASQNAEPHLF